MKTNFTERREFLKRAGWMGSAAMMAGLPEGAMAFGGGAADALFGAGSGSVLTKITKYATVVFVLLALFLGHLQAGLRHAGNGSAFEKAVQQKQTQSPAPEPQLALPPAVAPTNNLLSMPLNPDTNEPAK